MKQQEWRELADYCICFPILKSTQTIWNAPTNKNSSNLGPLPLSDDWNEDIKKIENWNIIGVDSRERRWIPDTVIIVIRISIVDHSITKRLELQFYHWHERFKVGDWKRCYCIFVSLANWEIFFGGRNCFSRRGSTWCQLRKPRRIEMGAVWKHAARIYIGHIISWYVQATTRQRISRAVCASVTR